VYPAEANRAILTYPVAFALLAVQLVFTGCGRGQIDRRLLQFQGTTMGTTYTVKVVDPPRAIQPSRVETAINEVLQTVNGRMSTYLEDSELSRFNRSQATDWVDASQELVTVLQEAQHVSALTEDAFDVTVGPLVNLWGFGPEREGSKRIPSQDAIEEAMAKVGYTRVHVRVSPPGIKKEIPDLYLDLSAIAKGYAVDRVAERLESCGCNNYMVEVGGEVRVKGHNARAIPWRIAIEKPTGGERSAYKILELQGQALATSGDYRNYFEADGQRYSHTINPATGRPIAHRLASVTVISRTSMFADAMATALLVLGPERGYLLAERNGLAAFFIIKADKGFTDRSTSAFGQFTR
jgi:thiamine biosynthesis lipoprotein